jgi:hypothetical protein
MVTGLVNILVVRLENFYDFNIVTLSKCIPPLGTINRGCLTQWRV